MTDYCPDCDREVAAVVEPTTCGIQVNCPVCDGPLEAASREG